MGLVLVFGDDIRYVLLLDERTETRSLGETLYGNNWGFPARRRKSISGIKVKD
jgi:hypothetical protein